MPLRVREVTTWMFDVQRPAVFTLNAMILFLKKVNKANMVHRLYLQGVWVVRKTEN